MNYCRHGSTAWQFAKESAPSSFSLTQNFALTPDEEELFQLVDETLAFHKSNTVVRVAGGWVRDKLLNLPNHDIDLGMLFVFAVET